MGLVLHLFLALALSSCSYVIYVTYLAPPGEVEVKVEENGWFGSGEPRSDDLGVYPFQVNVTPEELEDLKQRLERSRVSHAPLEDSNDFWYGFNSYELEVFREYWLRSYDWKKHEKIINGFKQFKTEIEGIKVHFIHEQAASGYKRVVPLLIVHGWPGNVFEFYKLIPMLTDPKKHGIKSEIAFEVVAPSIPGYGWSEQPKRTGFSQVVCARVFRKLMERLGIKKFYLQGGDWGSLIVSNLAKLYPAQVFGVHMNMLGVMPGSSTRAFLLEVVGTTLLVFSFSRLLIFSFLSLFLPGTALNDSPLGLAAYILEKFSSWTNLENRALPDGGLTKKFTRDELLTIVMIYWLNGNIVSSQRFYREFFLDKRNDALAKHYQHVPTAHLSCLNEMFDRTPPEISSVLYNVTHYTTLPDAGHFAAFEMPRHVAIDVFDFVKSLEH
ncbi:unnamed protein product [Nippostrongylus brasiliensis]|uniref:Epoxide hydrolase n=1 Tax=Nippostrongylus brasiliensis TaxID=27835 RepID=A0A0N4YCE7_NIPBR|nr:unnamed protein product [Nippostrongylus brasiliensis]